MGVLDVIELQQDAFAALASTATGWDCPHARKNTPCTIQRAGAGAPLLDLAMRLQMKAFLSHTHCQALVETWVRDLI
jgi:hypothetical protein